MLDDTTSNTPDDLDRAANGLLPLAKLLNNLEKSYDSGIKILDESKQADEDAALYCEDEIKFVVICFKICTFAIA